MTTEFLDKQFVKEFKQVCNQLRSQYSFNIQEIPNLPHLIEQLDLSKKLKIEGLTEAYLDELNGQYVDWLKQRVIDKNIYWNSGEVKKTVKYSVKKGTQLIRTTLNLKLPANVAFSEEGLEYVDYVDIENKRFFYYTIPDKYLYEVKETALVISERLKPQHYGGYRLVSTKGYTFYLYIVHLKNFKMIDTQKILATKIGVNYTEEINQLLTYWLSQQLIFNPNDLEVSIPIDMKGSTNLALTYLEPTLSGDDLESDFSIGDLNYANRDLSKI